MSSIILICAIACVCLYVIFSMMIVHQLSRRGVKISFLLLRLYIIKYIHQYKKMTLEETGKVGPLYYPCIISVNMALVFALLYFIL
jgi:hypothetical protein